MLKRFYPTFYIPSIFELDLALLKQQGIKGIIFDIDNTLVSYDTPQPNEALMTFFEHLKSEGFQLCLVSNNTEDRVVKFNEHLKLFAVHKAAKPRRRALKKAMAFMQLTESQVAMVGDQVFTDVWVANRVGVTAILVAPVSPKDEWITKVKRGIEKRVIQRYEKHTRK